MLNLIDTRITSNIMRICNKFMLSLFEVADLTWQIPMPMHSFDNTIRLYVMVTEDYCLLGCNTMYSGRLFQKNVMTIKSY
jgi:hypothetical protein